MSFLQLVNLNKKYSSKGPMIVKNANLNIEKGEFVVFLGPSGCGKTTIIRMIAGLEEVTGGDIRVEGKSIVDLQPKDRGVSMIFQSYAVWPHMTVYNNIAYPLKLKKYSKEKIKEIVEDVAEGCELTPYLKRYPSQLSGGQRQRVAVARAMAVKPEIFLMDEPLSNLDAKLRVSMRTELKRIHEKIGATSIFVTHDQSEAMSLADKIVVLHNGKIEQIGTPYEVYHESETVFVASFIGSPPTNFFDVDITRKEKGLYACCDAFEYKLNAKNAGILERYEGKKVKLGIRPENIVASLKKTLRTTVETKVDFAEPQGSYAILITKIAGQEVKVVSNDFEDWQSGKTAYLEFPQDKVAFFDFDTERRIKEDKTYEYLKELYPDDYAETYRKIEELKNKYAPDGPIQRNGLSQRDSILITYGDTLKKEGEKPLVTFERFARKYLEGKVSAIHFLPIYPYTSDDGFAVSDYRAVNPELGEWKDIEKIKDDGFDLMLDAVANHVSASSPYMRGYLAGDERYRNYFVECDPNADYSKVIRPRALPLLTPFDTPYGKKYLWTTFSEDQIDLNYKNPDVLIEILDVLLEYADKGARFIRLDAIGVLWKELGTKCMHLPETHKLIKIMKNVVESCFEVKFITETNVPHKDNISYFGDGDEADLVYQFPLPPLVMYTMLTGDTSKLREWAAILPEKMDGNAFFNFLSSHDGIGVRPVEKMLNDKELNVLLEHTVNRGGRISYRNMPDGSQSPYELNINYLDAVTSAEDDDSTAKKKFICAESIVLSMAGVPGIYIHSLLGSRNDVEGMKASGINRRINREKLDYEEVVKQLETEGSLRKEVYSAICGLLAIRSQHKAFSPSAAQKILDAPEGVFALERSCEEEKILYAVNMSGEPRKIAISEGGTDLLNGNTVSATELTLAPYEFVWLKTK